MPLDKKKIKEELEQERDVLVEQMKDMGRLNPQTNEWEAVPEAVDVPESDQNDMADRFEDYEAKSSMLRDLETRWKKINNALDHLDEATFGRCKICDKNIELARMKANPAARTCKKHLND